MYERTKKNSLSVKWTWLQDCRVFCEFAMFIKVIDDLTLMHQLVLQGLWNIFCFKFMKVAQLSEQVSWPDDSVLVCHKKMHDVILRAVCYCPPVVTYKHSKAGWGAFVSIVNSCVLYCAFSQNPRNEQNIYLKLSTHTRPIRLI